MTARITECLRITKWISTTYVSGTLRSLYIYFTDDKGVFAADNSNKISYLFRLSWRVLLILKIHFSILKQPFFLSSGRFLYCSCPCWCFFLLFLQSDFHIFQALFFQQFFFDSIVAFNWQIFKKFCYVDVKIINVEVSCIRFAT